MSAKRKPPPLSEREVVKRLEVKFSAPSYAFLPQVRNTTGFAGVKTIRTADAIAMGLWPSRGLELSGFEVKSARSDWLNELKNPEKGEEISKFCHRWWIVTGEKGLVHDGELPETWGLMVPRGKGLQIVKPAPLLEPTQISYSFLASLLRRMTEDFVPKSVIRERVENGVAREMKYAQTPDQATKDELERTTRAHQRLLDRVSQFRKESGVDLFKDSWSLGNIGEAVRAVREAQVPHHLQQLKAISDMASRIARQAIGAHKDLSVLTHDTLPSNQVITTTGSGDEETQSPRSTKDPTSP